MPTTSAASTPSRRATRREESMAVLVETNYQLKFSLSRRFGEIKKIYRLFSPPSRRPPVQYASKRFYAHTALPRLGLSRDSPPRGAAGDRGFGRAAGTLSGALGVSVGSLIGREPTANAARASRETGCQEGQAGLSTGPSRRAESGLADRLRSLLERRGLGPDRTRIFDAPRGCQGSAGANEGGSRRTQCRGRPACERT